ncbi:MAG TPA: hypothetical protein EYP95_06950 [Nitrospinaceae bacterium]|nr:hypothetical protein [Nitrospinaceae bacterium]
MKIKQTVEAKFSNLYIGWNGLSFTDPNGDEVIISTTDNQILELAEALNEKAEGILESRKEQEVE